MMQIDSMAGAVLPSFSFEGDKSLTLAQIIQEANTEEEEEEDIQLNEGQGEELLRPKKFNNTSLGNVEDDTFAGLDTSGFESFTSPALSHSLLSENISSSQLFGSNEHFSDPARGLAELAPQPNNTSVHHHHQQQQHHFMTGKSSIILCVFFLNIPTQNFPNQSTRRSNPAAAKCWPNQDASRIGQIAAISLFSNANIQDPINRVAQGCWGSKNINYKILFT